MFGSKENRELRGRTLDAVAVSSVKSDNTGWIKSHVGQAAWTIGSMGGISSHIESRSLLNQ